MRPLSLHYRYEIEDSDRIAIREILESTGFFYEFEIVIAEELFDERKAKGDSSGYFFVFAMDGDKAVSYSCYGPIACTRQSYDLFWIGTHADYRGKGVGKQILKETNKQVFDRGGRYLYAETSGRDQYAPTHQFYKSTGFDLEGRLRDFYDTGDDKLIYRLDLTK